MANEIDEKINVEDADAAKSDSVDEQVEQRMQRLNLYFEKENVSIYPYKDSSIPMYSIVEQQCIVVNFRKSMQMK